MAEEKWYNAEVIRIEDITENTKRFWFKVNELEQFQFTAGQFVTMDLPIHEKKNMRWRSYSIASAPDGTNVFELVIVLVEDGLGTNYLWKNVHEGSTVVLKGPLGKFTLPETIDHDVALICTGTGIAPFRSMVQSLVLNPKEFKKIYLIFGCRFDKDVLYKDELKQLMDKLPNYEYHIALSREEPTCANARKGYVHQIYEDIFADKRPAHFYLCGWRNMIDEAKQRIVTMGYDRKAVHVEIYG